MNSESNLYPVNIKYIVLLRKCMSPICVGCLISARHIVTAGGCIHLLLHSENHESKLFGAIALIGRKEHKIIDATYHRFYKSKSGGSARLNDVGIALVCLSISSYLVIKLICW